LATFGTKPSVLGSNAQVLRDREHCWDLDVNPSYNVAATLDRFVGEKHPRWGVPRSDETKAKLSKKLAGRKLTEEHVESIRESSHKVPIYCYDYDTKEFVVKFEGVRGMARELKLASNTQIYRKLDNNKRFNTVYNGIQCSWSLSKLPLNPPKGRP
jgi:hypothetical protein